MGICVTWLHLWFNLKLGSYYTVVEVSLTWGLWRPPKTKLVYAVTCPSPVKSQVFLAFHPAGVFTDLNWTLVEQEKESDNCRITLSCRSAAVLCSFCCLFSLPVFFQSPGKRDKQSVQHLKAEKCVVRRLLVSFNDFSIVMCSIVAIYQL